MKLMFGPENALMELAGIVWAEKEEEDQTVRIELIGV